jgi:hypothetical protein
MGALVDVHIGRLRKLLNPGREQDPIPTVRGAGYALDDRFAKAEQRSAHPDQSLADVAAGLPEKLDRASGPPPFQSEFGNGSRGVAKVDVERPQPCTTRPVPEYLHWQQGYELTARQQI